MKLPSRKSKLSNGATSRNTGRASVPHAVSEIRTRSGDVVYRRQPWPDDRLIATANVRQMNEMLSEVIRSGTGKAARPGNRPAAGKTGTTQDYRDGWFVGYTADLVAGVWIGNDNNAPMRRGGGGDVPARIWRQFVVSASKDMPMRPLRDVDDGDLIAAGEILQRVAAWFRALTGDASDGAGSEEETQQKRLVIKVEDWLRRNFGVVEPAPQQQWPDVE